MSSTTFTYKTDPSAGAIPATIHYTPASATNPSPRPAVLIFHAGGYTTGGTFMIPRSQIDALLALSFVVITPEYRLCPQVSVFDGPVTDARECLAWSQRTLPSLLQSTAGVTIDPARIAAMGHSCGGNLALLLGGETVPPRAILSLYPGVYPDRDFYHTPLAAFTGMPDTDVAFQDKVFAGAVPYSSPPMLTRDGRPDLATPRSAWMIANLKAGTQMAKVVGDGNYKRVDGACQFRYGFPATAIVQGKKDVFTPFGYAVEAARSLKAVGTEVDFISVPEASHMFDVALKREDEQFAYVQRGLDFLARHV